MRRTVLAFLIILHAFAHAAIGMWAVADGFYVASVLWAVAVIGYLGAGFGMLRVPGLRRVWRRLLIAGTLGSLLLLFLYGNAIGVIGVPIDLLLAYLALERSLKSITRDVDAARVGVTALPHPLLHRIGWTAGALVFTYAAAVVLVRPLFLRYGTTAAERMATLPGDELTPYARYRVDHAITIHAPADSVWPWLVQLGQDRGGFYSYSRLERMVGDEVTNADRIHPEWQSLAIGDTIRSVQRGYLGGRAAKAGLDGWRIDTIVPGRALVLHNWGAFVLRPVDSMTTRFIVRTRGPGTRNFGTFAASPFGVFVFEPAHFIMQERMLRGVRDRAEGMMLQQP